MPIDYDPSIESLIHPEARETVFTAGMQYSRVQLAVEAARLAYYKAEDKGEQFARLEAALQRDGFSRLAQFSSEIGTQAFAAFRDKDQLALVSFRGTEPNSIADIGIDASAVLGAWQGVGLVHIGFAEAFDSVRVPIKHWLDTVANDRAALLLCGHSLGAALATLAASVWQPAQLITIGSPLVGNRQFVDSLIGTEYLRIVNCCDLVARVPPSLLGYEHLPRPTFVTYDGKLSEDPSAAAIDLDRHCGRGEYFSRYALRLGNAPARDLADHAPVNYLRAFLP
jgi:hypothetical protein